MATHCFCGCGRPVHFGRRALSLSGRRIDSELEWWEAYGASVQKDRDDLSEAVRGFMAEGLWLLENLAAIIHREDHLVDPGFDNSMVHEWLRFSRSSRRRIEADLAPSW